ncbi:FKBP-type peptidyl-prolyl cis-trans isomerase [Raoultella sp. BIGb0399]|uniref:peptidylprolyl isomerase n=1 Tax=Raoultella lignicola TaxID=3040939 RepID=A0ABU9F1U3_9ENTR|nr:FKBP-type peptidyl-prolyl cis-trans isomerase N-terminal domain-containing protein [Raoultella sp. BIGb0399]ROS07827.1 FKBP-type peptidyl-prolyl cis-trans isomerase [Raoultella sp. BIGb0399]
MNRLTAINLKVIALAMTPVLASFLVPNAYAEKDVTTGVVPRSDSDNSGPAFLIFAKQQQEKEKEKKSADRSIEHKTSETNSNTTRTTNNTPTQKTKNISQQNAVIAQKDKIIRQLKKQLATRPSEMIPVADNQKELTDKIKQLQGKLETALAEKQQLIIKESTAVNDKKQSNLKLDATENKNQKQSIALAAVEAEKQKLEALLAKTEVEKQTQIKKFATLTSDQQALTLKLATEAQEKQLLAEKITNATAQTQTLTEKLNTATAAQQTLTAQLSTATAEKKELMAKLTTAELGSQALTAKLDAFVINKKKVAQEDEAFRLQVDKDKALLQAKTDELNQLKAAQANAKPDKKSAGIDLTQKSQQQAYALGASMGDGALEILAMRNTQGMKINQDVVLQGFADSFSGKFALDESTRKTALIDATKEVSLIQNKVEKQNISDGKAYQQKFAKQKGVEFKNGIYSRVDYAGKGKILGSDIVTVTIKEALIDGTIIQDMEAEKKVWSQVLNAYPPSLLEPMKRLENHGTVTIVLPPDAAYGSEGVPPKIPPGATMVYTVRIVDATAEKPPANKP